MHGQIDMRTFARGAGATVTYQTGAIIFNKGDTGGCMYIVQSGVIEMVIGETVVETCGANEAIRFMVDEVPNFAQYIMGAMARRIRGMGEAM
jgi:hypothetical protein